jgi:fibronectin type 3 domain-containing protein
VFVLDTDAFKLCPDLKTVRIAKGVDTIGHEVFGWCPALTEIWCGAAEKPLNWCDDWLGENDPAPTVHWGELAPPSNVTAKGLTAGGIKVSWGLSEGATKYNVYRKISGGSWANIGYSRGASYTDTTAEAGTVYYYRVRAQVSKNYSPYSANASARWLAAPASPTLTNSTAGVKVTWSEVNGASLYYVWRAEGNGSFKKLAECRTMNYTDKTAKSGVTYRYAIKARYSSTYSAQGAESKTMYLAAPTMTIKAYASGIKVTWETVPGATLYNVYRAAAGGSYAKIGTSRTLGYVDRTAASGKTYSYYVVAQYSSYKSSHNAAVTATAK